MKKEIQPYKITVGTLKNSKKFESFTKENNFHTFGTD